MPRVVSTPRSAAAAQEREQQGDRQRQTGTREPLQLEDDAARANPRADAQATAVPARRSPSRERILSFRRAERRESAAGRRTSVEIAARPGQPQTGRGRFSTHCATACRDALREACRSHARRAPGIQATAASRSGRRRPNRTFSQRYASDLDVRRSDGRPGTTSELDGSPLEAPPELLAPSTDRQVVNTMSSPPSCSVNRNPSAG